MHSEAEIRRAIKPLLDRYGQLTTSEVKQRLDEVLVFDDDDKVMSQTRKEILIMQRIGNIVAHQTEQIREYEEGFIVYKNYRPAVFTAVTGISNKNLSPISDAEIKKKKKEDD